MTVSIPGGLVAGGTTHRPVRVGPVFTVLSAPRPPKKRSHAADRTRSKRWRAGTRRHRKYGSRSTPAPKAELGEVPVPAR